MNCKVPPEDVEGYMLQLDGNVVVDLGDDAYTQGKPHPMIDPAKRIECMQEAVDDPSTGVVLLDIMLGYGSHADMAGSLIPTIKELQQDELPHPVCMHDRSSPHDTLVSLQQTE